MGNVEIFRFVLSAVYALLVLCSVVALVLENRQPVKTIAWLLVLLAFPVVGLVVFYFFGQDWRRERTISRKSLSLLTRKALLGYSTHAPRSVPTHYERLIRYFENENLAMPYAGNRAEVYTAGRDFIAALTEQISNARHHVHLETYIIEADQTGRRVAEALKAAARRGVEVRLVYDDVGCLGVPASFFDDMMRAGVDVAVFLPVRFPRFTRKVNFRNHRKVCVVDGRTGFVGGMNIADRYLGGPDGMAWRDMHLKVEGSAVYGMQQTFLLDWYFTTRMLINDSIYYPPIAPRPDGFTIQIVNSSPAARWPDIMYGYTWAFNNARRYIYIATPYFMPTEPILSALQMAAASGVDVRLMVTARPDGYWVRWANESYYADVLSAGVKLYRFGPGFHHSKYIVIDDEMAVVGSANMDFRSFENNFETNAFVYDAGAAHTVRRSFEGDLESCHLVTPREWAARPRCRRVAESFVRILSPLF